MKVIWSHCAWLNSSALKLNIEFKIENIGTNVLLSSFVPILTVLCILHLTFPQTFLFINLSLYYLQFKYMYRIGQFDLFFNCVL